MKAGLRYKVCILVSMCVAALFAFLFFQEKANPSPAERVEVRANLPQYHYVNPLLFTKDPAETASAYASIKKDVDSYISDITKAEKADSVSFYYRDLNTGRWTGVNETKTYIPGSMLKVYLLMAYLQIAESEPTVLKNQLLYASSTRYGKEFVPAHPLVVGRHYSVEDLLGRTIIESDDESAYLLLNNLNDSYKESILKELDLPSPLPDGTEEISPQAFSHFFRALYNATFLSRDLSEQALSLMTQTTYTDGIVAGVPADVKVAHKFGEFVMKKDSSADETKLLHDCGIVYYPKTPYFLCVMTKGSDFGELSKVIQHISSIVYARESELGKK